MTLSREEERKPVARGIAALYERTHAQFFDFSLQEFAAALDDVTQTAAPPNLTAEQTLDFQRSLHLEELALARACALGIEKAWIWFISRYGELLRKMAASITKDMDTGRELADSLHAELFGAKEGADGRASKFLYYTGRGSLEGWLRTVLAQEYLNRCRQSRRLVHFDDRLLQPDNVLPNTFAAEPVSGGLNEAGLNQAIETALEQLPPEAKLYLVSYYLDRRTLSEIGRMLGVHESTVSRRLVSITSALRKQIVHNLRASGLSKRAAEEAIAVDVRDISIDIRGRLVPESCHGSPGQLAANSKERRG